MEEYKIIFKSASGTTLGTLISQNATLENAAIHVEGLLSDTFIRVPDKSQRERMTIIVSSKVADVVITKYIRETVNSKPAYL
ncbi:hypothetical protein [Viridibacillus arvi]|uniref:hypothetical protein n=1 Tax=Viridibacillus arvi TaxID=263475 RepID=UPI003CFFDEF1